MGNRAKLTQEGVVERADGRRLVRIFVYFDEANAKRLKRYCFERGETLSDFIDGAIAEHLKDLKSGVKTAPEIVVKAKPAKKTAKRRAKKAAR